MSSAMRFLVIIRLFLTIVGWTNRVKGSAGAVAADALGIAAEAAAAAGGGLLWYVGRVVPMAGNGTGREGRCGAISLMSGRRAAVCVANLSLPRTSSVSFSGIK